ncbi:MAG: HAMP domain-containing sensor histidine kinase [Planctomycetota bacterium]
MPEMLKSLVMLGVSNEHSEIEQLRYKQFNALLLFVSLALGLTLATNLVEQSWRPYDTVLYGGALAILPLALLLNKFGLFQVSIPFIFYSNTIVHFFLTLTFESSFISVMLALVFLSLSLQFFPTLGSVTLFAFLQMVVMNAAMYFGESQTPANGAALPIRMFVFSTAYILQFGAAWYVKAMWYRSYSKNIQLMEALRDQNAKLQSSYEEMERFSLIVAHDLRGPLQVVASYTEILKLQLGRATDEAIMINLEQIENGIQKQSKMLHEILEYSRLDGNKNIASKNISLAYLSEELARDYRTLYPACKIEIQGDSEIFANESQIRVLIQNLIENGLKYNESLVPTITIELAVSRSGKRRIRVRDNGIGIPPEKLDTPFELFARLHPNFGRDGSGIGLAHCKKIVNQYLHGRISIQSQVGEGTTIAVVIPAANCELLQDESANDSVFSIL